jgi:hypothetical protein
MVHWGIDFLEEETNNTTFQITNPPTTSQTRVYTIERNASVIGE